MSVSPEAEQKVSSVNGTQQHSPDYRSHIGHLVPLDCTDAQAYLGQRLVEVEVLLVRDVGRAAQPERLVVIEQVPVPDRLLDSLRLGLVLFLLVPLLICAEEENALQRF